MQAQALPDPSHLRTSSPAQALLRNVDPRPRSVIHSDVAANPTWLVMLFGTKGCQAILLYGQMPTDIR